MTVSQTLSLYFAAGDLKIDDAADAEKFNAILINRVFNDDDFLKISGKLNNEEMAVALEFWKETNKAFFKSSINLFIFYPCNTRFGIS